jgi:prepilin-type N-terminal cleavage/methylation domain-containing protein
LACSGTDDPEGGSRIRNDRGFTLIELLIVVVIIGILASIAIPKFGATKDKAYIASIKSDLRNLVTAEEMYFADNLAYTTSFPTTSFSSSAGVTVSISAANVTGWTASAAHVALPSKPCFIFAGTGGPSGLATVESEVKCTP